MTSADLTPRQAELLLNGDFDFNGNVNNDDFGQFLYGFNGGGTARWLNGDFDYNGVVDSDDFGWFLTGLGAFNMGGNAPL